MKSWAVSRRQWHVYRFSLAISVGERGFNWLCNLKIEDFFLSFTKKSSICHFGLTGVQAGEEGRNG